MLEKMARMERLRELQRQREQDGEAGESPLAQPHAQRAPAPLLTFTPSVELNELVRPMDRCGRRRLHHATLIVVPWHVLRLLTSSTLSRCRLHVPLGDEAAVAVGKLFHVDHMIEYVARARRTAVGSMFPTDLHPSSPPPSAS